MLGSIVFINIKYILLMYIFVCDAFLFGVMPLKISGERL